MADTYFLVVDSSGDQLRRVSFLTSEFADEGSLHQGHLRQSPVFPVSPVLFARPSLEGPWYLDFYSATAPLEAMGRILAEFPTSRDQLLFSHGLASIISISEDEGLGRNIASFVGESLLAHERWQIVDSIVVGTEHKKNMRIAAEPETAQFDVQVDKLPPDFRILLHELKFSIEVAIGRAREDAPALIPAFASLIETVDAMAQEVQFLTLVTDDVPPTLSAEFAQHLRQIPVECQRRLNQRTDQVVQLNSALSYVVSQTFAGSIPIMERECQVRTYSLLGVGSAVMALFHFSEFVRSKFQRYPIHEALVERFPHISGVPVFPDLRDFNPKVWAERNSGIDEHLAGLGEPVYRPKLVFFSGRLGFKETEFSVAAAIQSLAASDSSRWSLMTLSHELMHAHVRAILGALFKDKREQVPESRFDLFYDDYKINFEQSHGNYVNMSQSMRSILMNYVVQKRHFERIAEEVTADSLDEVVRGGREITRDLTLPSSRTLRRWWQDEFRDINEILTHVLDFYYFYNADPYSYLGLLWESWATVPSVLSEIDHYLFRSLVAVATVEKGSVAERFEAVRNRLRARLVEIADSSGGPVIKAALEFFEDKDKWLPLRIRFIPALYLAEAATRFLKSRRLHADLVKDDPYLDLENGEYSYKLDTGEFPSLKVVSPVAFVADRLKRALGEVDFEQSERYRSAWVFLALGRLDVTQTKGGGDAE